MECKTVQVAPQCCYPQVTCDLQHHKKNHHLLHRLDLIKALIPEYKQKNSTPTYTWKTINKPTAERLFERHFEGKNPCHW